MNPYGSGYNYGPGHTYMGNSQASMRASPMYQGPPPPHQNQVYQGPPPPVTPKPVNHTTGMTLRERIRIQNLRKSIWPSVLGSIVIQAVAAFFFIIASQTFSAVLQNAEDFSSDPSDDLYVLFIVFFVFMSISSAMSAPMIQNSGYATVILGGSVLMLFSTMTSSLTTSADVLIIPFSVYGGCAYGLLRTAPQVAMLDYLNNRRAIATGLSYLGVTVGVLAGSLSYQLTDLKDDAEYDDDGPARWPNNMRVIEVTVVAALLSVAVLRKPSFNTGSWPEVFRYPPFYVLCVLYFFYNLGERILTIVYDNVPEEREFRANIKNSSIMTAPFIGQIVSIISTLVILAFARTCCVNTLRRSGLTFTAIVVAVLAAASFLNDVVIDEFWIFCIYTSIQAFVGSLVRITIPLALINYTGRINYKIALPFLEVSGGLGSLIAFIILIELDIPDDTSLEAGWYIAAAMMAITAGIALWAGCKYLPWIDHVTEDGANNAREVEAVENAAFEEDAELAVDYFNTS